MWILNKGRGPDNENQKPKKKRINKCFQKLDVLTKGWRQHLEFGSPSLAASEEIKYHFDQNM
jgi:hypothetical protein